MIRLDIEDTRPSVFDSFAIDESRPLEKMSKSKGNCTTVDMVVHGAVSLIDGYEFRDCHNRKIHDWKRCGVWRDKSGSGCFYTSANFGGQPVLLCEVGAIVPPPLLVNGVERMQHTHLRDLWGQLEDHYPDEFYETGEVQYIINSAGAPE